MVDAVVERLREHVRPHFGPECVGHDLAHLDRVNALALRLTFSEGGDRLVLGAASYVHDFHRVIERLNADGEKDADTAESRIDDALASVAFPDHLRPAVIECVAFTDRYSFSGHVLDAPSLEARLLRDADNLDAMGAIGIARAFMFGGILGEPIWIDDSKPSETYTAGVTSSIVHHFHEKLLRLRNDMLTDAGGELARERHEFMVRFLHELRREWEMGGLSQSQAPTLQSL
jgi:uncharacterized protein